jgi:hypothetical protein
VVHTGYGVFYDAPLAHAGPNAASLGFESSGTKSSPDAGVTPALIMAQGVTGVALTAPPLEPGFGAVRVGQPVSTSVTFFERDRATPYSQQFNFGIQRELPASMVASVSYLGNLGRKIPLASLPMNQVRPELLGPGNAQTKRPFPQFAGVSLLFPAIGNNNYHAGMAKLEKRFSHGLSLLTTYTWSRNIGNVDQQNIAQIGDNAIYQDYYNRRLDKGADAIDVVHRFTLTGVYDLPFGKGRAWVQKGLLAQVLGGWTMGSLTTLQSGGPFTVTMRTDTTNAFPAGTQRANVLRDGNLPKNQRTVERWFDTDAFTAPAAYTFGNAGRGILRADGRINIDLSLNKRFYLSESVYAKFTGEFFNSMNHPDFAPPGFSLGAPGFGQVTDATDGRVVQLGLQIVF